MKLKCLVRKASPDLSPLFAGGHYLIALFAALFFCLSCASVKDAGGEPRLTAPGYPDGAAALQSGPSDPAAGSKELPEAAASLLPLETGWYQYNFERTLKGIETEYDFKMSTGMDMIYEVSYNYSGVVCRFEDGTLYDPVTDLELSIEKDGFISCTENISIKGKIENDGRFFWSGQVEEYGKLNSIFVNGHLISLPPSVRGGPEYDGVYYLRDPGTGREQLAKISGGFYTWHYLDGEEAGFEPWPTLIQPDGSFSFSVEITTVAVMGTFARTNTSAAYSFIGNVIPGKGITVEGLTRAASQGVDQGGAPQIYAGTTIRTGEFPNEKVPADIESLIGAGKAALHGRPKPNPAKYPSWYLKPPEKPGFIYAAGEKTFAVKETAMAMAEAAAAATLLEQLKLQLESELVIYGNEGGTRFDEHIRTEAFQRLNYRIVEQSYNEETNTAFVLAEMAADTSP